VFTGESFAVNHKIFTTKFLRFCGKNFCGW